MPDPLGIYRIEVTTSDGPAHWGPTFNDADDAKARVEDAQQAVPEASKARVVSLLDNGDWERVK